MAINFKISVFSIEDEQKALKTYKSRTAPEVGDDVKVDGKILYIAHREFNSDRPEKIKVFGYFEE
jgi:hypothetical protein